MGRAVWGIEALVRLSREFQGKLDTLSAAPPLTKHCCIEWPRGAGGKGRAREGRVG